MFRSLILLVVLPLLVSAIVVKNQFDKKYNILFVGNSLTYANDLPEIVKEIAKEDNVAITFNSIAFPDYSLEDHWNEGKVQKEIESGKYDFVVAQQGPSALPASQLLLLEYTKKLAEVCSKNKTKLAVYMVWPSKSRLFDLETVISSYTKAATETSSLLCPAGLAWKYAWQEQATLPLYSADNFHPSLMGSLLAALVIYGTLTKKKSFDFLQYDGCFWKNEIEQGNHDELITAAIKAINKQEFN